MEPSYQKLFKHLKPVEPSAGLLSVVMTRLEAEERRAIARSRRRLFFASLFLLASLGALIPVFRVAYTDLAASGFFQYLSLLFSDFSIIASSWQSYAFSLLETLPVLSLTLCFGVIFIFLAALRFLARDFRSITRHSTA
ncbi:MAG TPA: hypothetical protein P5267_00110 [Patescibacteria group bacterium]|nr:hypothetical protein [Patescibacteria group bacterium]